MAVKTAGPNATPLANWHGTPIQGTCIGERLIAGTIVFSTAGAVSSVSGIGVSAVTTASGVYRVYIPPCTQMVPMVIYGTLAVYANDVAISTISPTSGYFDLVVKSAGGLTNPSSGDYVNLHVWARTRSKAV